MDPKVVYPGIQFNNLISFLYIPNKPVCIEADTHSFQCMHIQWIVVIHIERKLPCHGNTPCCDVGTFPPSINTTQAHLLTCRATSIVLLLCKKLRTISLIWIAPNAQSSSLLSFKHGASEREHEYQRTDQAIGIFISSKKPMQSSQIPSSIPSKHGTTKY